MNTEPKSVRHLFLDLEDTVITSAADGWERTECINQDRIEKVLNEFKPDFIHLFSFAIWNNDELEKFKQTTLFLVQRVHKIKIDLMWTVDDDIIPMCAKELGLNKSTIEFSDASAFWSKHQSFRLCMRQHFKNRDSDLPVQVMLLDDAVFTETFEWRDMNLTGIVQNVDEL